MRKILVTAVAMVALVVAVAVTQVAVFVVPAGASVTPAATAAPSDTAAGMVYIVTRGADMRFVDSADAICQRQFSRPDEGCRGLVRSWVMRETRVLAELPYSETLWRVAAGGGKQ